MSELTIHGLTYHYDSVGKGIPLLMLHGFTGTGRNWWGCAQYLVNRYQVVMVDLPGHGQTDAPADPQRYAMDRVARDMVGLMHAVAGVAPFHLVGYSMGGRLALYIALHYMANVRALVLESASPGLSGDIERSERRQQDEALADRIERDGVAAFVDYWESIPLFASQKHLDSQRQYALREQRLQNRAYGLANSLRGMGTGVQPALWGMLGALTVPCLLLNGELDTKFVAIGQRMLAAMPQAQQIVIQQAGHTLHLEVPALYYEYVAAFLEAKC